MKKKKKSNRGGARKGAGAKLTGDEKRAKIAISLPPNMVRFLRAYPAISNSFAIEGLIKKTKAWKDWENE